MSDRVYRFVALSHTSTLGTFVLHIGKAGETRNDVNQRALGIIDHQTMLDAEWQREARANLTITSLSNARRLYGQRVREYLEEGTADA